MCAPAGGLTLAPSAIGLREWFDSGHRRFFGDFNCSGWGPTRRDPARQCTHAGTWGVPMTAVLCLFAGFSY